MARICGSDTGLQIDTTRAFQPDFPTALFTPLTNYK